MSQRHIPDLNSYITSLQNPALFKDPKLKGGLPVRNKNGRLYTSAGQFALTAAFDDVDGRRWAIRCFTSEPPADIKMRYNAISEFIAKNKTPILVDINFQEQGIGILANNGLDWWPICKMEWVEGVTLNKYLDEHIKDPDIISGMPREFGKLCEELESLPCAHGDLQHGNIMLRNHRFVLVDYDGMWVPAYEGKNMVVTELGQRNYQHPARSMRHFGPELDRFSMIALYLSLRALAVNPNLYESENEQVYLGEEDYENPKTSARLKKMQGMGFDDALDNFRDICQDGFGHIPTFQDFINSSNSLKQLYEQERNQTTKYTSTAPAPSKPAKRSVTSTSPAQRTTSTQPAPSAFQIDQSMLMDESMATRPKASVGAAASTTFPRGSAGTSNRSKGSSATFPTAAGITSQKSATSPKRPTASSSRPTTATTAYTAKSAARPAIQYALFRFLSVSIGVFITFELYRRGIVWFDGASSRLLRQSDNMVYPALYFGVVLAALTYCWQSVDKYWADWRIALQRYWIPFVGGTAAIFYGNLFRISTETGRMEWAVPLELYRTMRYGSLYDFALTPSYWIATALLAAVLFILPQTIDQLRNRFMVTGGVGYAIFITALLVMGNRGMPFSMPFMGSPDTLLIFVYFIPVMLVGMIGSMWIPEWVWGIPTAASQVARSGGRSSSSSRRYGDRPLYQYALFRAASVFGLGMVLWILGFHIIPIRYGSFPTFPLLPVLLSSLMIAAGVYVWQSSEAAEGTMQYRIRRYVLPILLGLAGTYFIIGYRLYPFEFLVVYLPIMSGIFLPGQFIKEAHWKIVITATALTMAILIKWLFSFGSLTIDAISIAVLSVAMWVPDLVWGVPDTSPGYSSSQSSSKTSSTSRSQRIASPLQERWSMAIRALAVAIPFGLFINNVVLEYRERDEGHWQPILMALILAIGYVHVAMDGPLRNSKRTRIGNVIKTMGVSLIFMGLAGGVWWLMAQGITEEYSMLPSVILLSALFLITTISTSYFTTRLGYTFKGGVVAFQVVGIGMTGYWLIYSISQGFDSARATDILIIGGVALGSAVAIIVWSGILWLIDWFFVR